MREKYGTYKKLFLRAATLGAFAAPIVFGLASGAIRQASSQAASQPPSNFEIVSIKPTDPKTQQRKPIGMFTYPGGRLIITQYTLKMLIQDAYGVNENQISRGPYWIDQDKFDIEAVPPAASEAGKFSPATPKTAPSAEMLSMLRNLLADRFQLQIHTESKMEPGYALVAGPHGAKLHETKNHDAFKVVSYGRTGKPELTDYIVAENVSMSMFAAWLAREYRCPVLDQTGIKGDFDFKVEYGDVALETAVGPSLFSQIQAQLGLKMVTIKAPVENIVIDRAEKPSSN